MNYTKYLLLTLLTLPTAHVMARSSALHEAIKSDNTEKVKELIKNGTKVYDPSLLYEATSSGNVAIAKLLLDNGADVNGADRNGIITSSYTPLHIAAETGNLEMCQTLLSYGAKVDHQVDDGNWGKTETALVLAARYHHYEICELLIEKGADELAEQSWGNTVLDELYGEAKAEVIKLAVIKLLKEHGENFAKVKPAQARSLLYAAARSGNVAMAKLLLDNGADVNGADKDGTIDYTPLHDAAASGQLEMCQTLLSYGAKVDHKADTAFRDTALSLAAMSNHYEVCELLIEKGANVNVRVGATAWSKRLLHYVHSPRVKRLLKKHGATKDR